MEAATHAKGTWSESEEGCAACRDRARVGVRRGGFGGCGGLGSVGLTNDNDTMGLLRLRDKRTEGVYGGWRGILLVTLWPRLTCGAIAKILWRGRRGERQSR